MKNLVYLFATCLVFLSSCNIFNNRKSTIRDKYGLLGKVKMVEEIQYRAKAHFGDTIRLERLDKTRLSKPNIRIKFREDGNLETRIILSNDGQRSFKTSNYIYDDSGNLTDVITYYNDESQKIDSKISFFETDSSKSKIKYNKYGLINSKEVEFFNNFGQKIRKLKYGRILSDIDLENDTMYTRLRLNEKELYTYENGLLKVIDTYDHKDSLDWKEILSYDKNDSLVLNKGFNEKGLCILKHNYTRDSLGRCVTHKVSTLSKHQKYWNELKTYWFEYFENGNTKKYTKKERWEAPRIITYNNSGLVMTEKSQYSKKLTSYTYKYDDQNNWIQRIESYDNEVKYISERNVEYY